MLRSNLTSEVVGQRGPGTCCLLVVAGMNVREWKAALARREGLPLDLRNAVQMYPDVGMYMSEEVLLRNFDALLGSDANCSKCIFAVLEG